jgi:hypothetical protein
MIDSAHLGLGRRTPVVFLQLLRGSLLAWSGTAAIAALFAISPRISFSQAFALTAFGMTIFAFFVFMGALPGAWSGRRMTPLGGSRKFNRWQGRRGDRFGSGVSRATRLVTQIEMVGGISPALLAFLICGELAAYCWFFWPTP